MTNWSELKVADLKEELKSRGIPLTGLKLKQQFVDKLEELDAEQSAKDEVLDQSAEEPADGVIENDIAQNQDDPQSDQDKPKQSSDSDDAAERVAKLAEDLPIELKQEESQAKDEASPPPPEAESAQEEQAIRADDPFVVQERQEQESGAGMEVDEPGEDQPEQIHKGDTDSEELVSDELPIDRPARQNMSQSQSSSNANNTPGPEEHRKRKRRSATPIPDAQEVAQKKARMNDGTALTSQTESDALNKVQQATEAAQAIRSADGLGNVTEMRRADETPSRVDDTRTEASTTPLQKSQSRSRSPIQHVSSRSRSRSRSKSKTPSDRSISPAVHSATSSLYIRNFKRPLHLPTLRSHLLSIAKPSAEDPIKVFYLDSIRTHAFISFVSVSAASRVRNTMHGTRFPDEPMREPLWIDFIPDDKVQPWIDIESGSGGGGFGSGRTASKKYEVVYIDGKDEKVEAQLQEVSGTSTMPPQRPGFQQTRSSRAPIPQDLTVPAVAVSGVHPSRAALIPQSPEVTTSRSTQHARHAEPKRSHQGTGFRALDELFSSTVAKPKLYYKLVPQPVIDARLDTIRDLRVGHDQMGRTGDEGMKRYSFEADSPGSREEWVDKGPEFGFGRRGQDRLTGFGSSYGAGRGRGGGGGGFRGSRRGGDSWRGR